MIGMLTIVAAMTYQPLAAHGQVAAGARELTIDEVVARALADNPELRAARAEVDAAGGRLQQAGLRPNPELDLGGQKALSPDNNLTIAVRLPRVDGAAHRADRAASASPGAPYRPASSTRSALRRSHAPPRRCGIGRQCGQQREDGAQGGALVQERREHRSRTKPAIWKDTH